RSSSRAESTRSYARAWRSRSPRPGGSEATPAPERSECVPDAADGLRLAAFVEDVLPEASRRLVRRLIAEGAVRVNGRRAAKGHRLRAGDRVTVPSLPRTVAPEPDLALPIVHEDAALVVVVKPGGMPSHALDPRQRGTAAAFLLGRYPEMEAAGDR